MQEFNVRLDNLFSEKEKWNSLINTMASLSSDLTDLYTTTITNSAGVIILTRTSGTVYKAFYAGVQKGATNTGTGGNISNFTTKMIINAKHDGSGGFGAFTARLCQGAGMFDGLTDTNVADLTTAINNFNTTLSR